MLNTRLRLRDGSCIQNSKPGVPKRDGSGRGVGANRGRGGCNVTRGGRGGRGRRK
jgi:hypothetical protein